jgi:HK97 family phage portal protein
MSLLDTYKTFRHAWKAARTLSSLPHQSGVNDIWFGQNFDLWNKFWTDTGTPIDFAKDLRDFRESPIVMAGAGWIARGLNAPRMHVVDLDVDNKEQEVPDHPLVDLWNKPNRFYSGRDMWRGIAFSWVVDGDAYLLKVRNRLGQLAELWYEPHWTIRPKWVENSRGDDGFISNYEVNRMGTWYSVALDDVFVLRDGIDPATRKGWSPTSALIREYYTEQRLAQFTAISAKNGFVPPWVLGVGSEENPPAEGTVKDFKAKILEQMATNPGQPLVVSGNVHGVNLATNYKDIDIRSQRQIPQQVFCSVMGISPVSLYFDSGKDQQTFANVKQFLEHDYRSYMVPLQGYIAERFTSEILPEFEGQDVGNRKVAWDYADVPEMQRDLAAVAGWAIPGWEKGLFKRNEVRELFSYGSDENDEIYIDQMGQTPDEIFLRDQEQNPAPLEESETGVELPKANGSTTMTPGEMAAG